MDTVMQQSRTGLIKLLVYMKIALHVAWRYRRHASPRFLISAFRLLVAFSDNKLVRLNNTWKLHIYLPAYPTPAFFKAVEDKLLSCPPRPITMVLSVTRACPYKCPHCYQRLARGRDMTDEKLLETVDSLSEAGICFLNVEGGDAFLRYESLCKMLDGLDDSMEVWINTTGTNTTEEKLAVLKEKGLGGVMVSIHHPNPVKYDAFVGSEGAFELACNTLLLCDKLGLGTAINCVLTYEDIKEGTLDRIMKLAKGLNCGFVQLIHPKRAGKWLDNEEVNLKDDEIREYVSKAHRYYNKKRGFPALPAQAEEEHPGKFGCTCGGIDRFYIGAQGEVQPCEFLNVSFGNVNDEPFDVIFSRMRESFRIPCSEWCCQVHAESIYRYIREHGLTETPTPWEHTQQIIQQWEPGTPTKLYRKLGIYDRI